MVAEPVATRAASADLAPPGGSPRIGAESELVASSSPKPLLALDLVRATCDRFMRRRRTVRSGVIRIHRNAFVRELIARQLCLCLSLRAFGFLVEIPAGVVGPLWALADGMRMLVPLGARIHHVALTETPMPLRAGPYVLWLRGQFMPMRLLESGSVQFPSTAFLFRVVTGTAAKVFDDAVELAEVASDGRRRLRERLGREAGLILYLNLKNFPITAQLRSNVFERLLRAEILLVARDRELRSLLRDVRGGHAAAA